ncbi:hypothetical protein M427DRAFT_30292 [Gonapodya prolifera JEL478]|uniref:Uncharacterized protein n=1 Tax=Gonapodya prolifera (strain JEL478) TaxID=1344416 RepID=A0A139AM42_GONPJ|nr:hypothetical protein M427DRAFT_30292 [Gonapodya prolifera JEL478]|eukprot:KXS17847.1 hypothetical protein M427DRAFT_30292 [Gonapodya prolifera JEL478]
MKQFVFHFPTKSLAAPLGGQQQRTAPPAYTRSTGLDQKSYSAGQAGLWELEAPLTSVLRNTLAREHRDGLHALRQPPGETALSGSQEGAWGGLEPGVHASPPSTSLDALYNLVRELREEDLV